MRRIDLVAPRSLAGRTARAVHRAGVVHLVPFEAPSGIGPTTFAGSVDEMPATAFDQALQTVSDLEAQLGPRDQPTGGDEGDGAGGLAPRVLGPVAELWELGDDELIAQVDGLRSVLADVERLTEQRLRLGGEIARLDSYRGLVGGLQAVLGHLPSVRGYATTGLVVGARYRAVLAAVRAELERITGGRCEVVSADIGTDRIGAVLIYPLPQAADVRGLLGGRDIEEVTLPDELVGVPFDELGPRLAAARDRLGTERASSETKLASIRVRYGPEIAALRLVLIDRIAERRALGAAGASDHLIVLSGWLPSRDLE
jgi:vacuolar-type H+-ATPase subunit I/STV1